MTGTRVATLSTSNAGARGRVRRSSAPCCSRSHSSGSSGACARRHGNGRPIDGSVHFDPALLPPIAQTMIDAAVLALSLQRHRSQLLRLLKSDATLVTAADL